jgi:hypothetical protein
MSPRDRASYRRLLKKYDDALLVRERSLFANSVELRRGAPTGSKLQQALLVALHNARFCHVVRWGATPAVSVRASAEEIYEVLEIRIFRPRKRGGATISNIKSPKALAEQLRIGLKSNDQQAVALMFYGLIMWRRSRIYPEAGTGLGSVQKTVHLLPRKLARLDRWIDALIATFPEAPLVKDAELAAAEMVAAREAGTLERSPSRAG